MRKLFCWCASVTATGAIFVAFTAAFVSAHPNSYAGRLAIRAWCGNEQTPIVEQVAQIDPEPDRNDAAVFLGEPAVAQEFHKRLPLGVFAADQTEQTKANDDEEAGRFAKGPHNRLPGTILFSEETQEPPSASSEPWPQKVMPSAATNPEPGVIAPPATEDSGPQFMSYCVDEGDAKVLMPYAVDDFELNTDIDFSDAIRKEKELQNENYLRQPHDNQLNAFRQLGLSDNHQQWISGLLLNVVPCKLKWNEKATVDQSTLIQANSKTPLPVERSEPKGVDIKQTDDDEWSDLEPGRPHWKDLPNVARRVLCASPSKDNPHTNDRKNPPSVARPSEAKKWIIELGQDRLKNPFRDWEGNIYQNVCHPYKDKPGGDGFFILSEILPWKRFSEATLENPPENIDTIWPFHLLGRSLDCLLSHIQTNSSNVSLFIEFQYLPWVDVSRTAPEYLPEPYCTFLENGGILFDGPADILLKRNPNANMQHVIEHGQESGQIGSELSSEQSKKRKADKPSHLTPERVHGGIQ